MKSTLKPGFWSVSRPNTAYVPINFAVFVCFGRCRSLREAAQIGRLETVIIFSIDWTVASLIPSGPKALHLLSMSSCSAVCFYVPKNYEDFGVPGWTWASSGERQMHLESSSMVLHVFDFVNAQLPPSGSSAGYSLQLSSPRWKGEVRFIHISLSYGQADVRILTGVLDPHWPRVCSFCMLDEWDRLPMLSISFFDFHLEVLWENLISLRRHVSLLLYLIAWFDPLWLPLTLPPRK